MYLEFYGLKEKPFTLAPNPKYLFYSNGHKEVLSQMIYSITQECGFMALTGEVGTGKTLLINTILNTLPKTYQFANLHYTGLNPKGLIQSICNEFNIAYKNKTMAELIFMLQEYFKQQYSKDQKCILIIDEAQNLSRDNMEIIRLLTNTQSVEKQYFQILLVGQQELDENLKSRDLRQLKERIGLKAELEKLPSDEIQAYIQHRLKISGNGGSRASFSDDSIERIYYYSQGIPRRINILCDNALIIGYAEETLNISANMIDIVGKNKQMVEQKQQVAKTPPIAPIIEPIIEETTFSNLQIEQLNSLLRSQKSPIKHSSTPLITKSVFLKGIIVAFFVVVLGTLVGLYLASFFGFI